MSYFIPLWEKVLSDLAHCDSSYGRNRLIQLDDDSSGIHWEDLSQQFRDEPDNPLMFPFVQPPARPVVDLTGSPLQVIVKMASIELTPEKPSYQGTWHIEGVPAEGIISTGIFYFDEENIQDNFLRFREAINDPPADYETNCPLGFSFGMHMNRDLGHVQTKKGRLLAFPNTLQHRVSPVKLKDNSKPGFRKLLVFFLVDPNKREQVISTSRVPPQQREWHPHPSKNDLVTLDQAKKDREDLMFTRKFYVISQNERLFEREFTFCEH